MASYGNRGGPPRKTASISQYPHPPHPHHSVYTPSAPSAPPIYEPAAAAAAGNRYPALPRTPAFSEDKAQQQEPFLRTSRTDQVGGSIAAAAAATLTPAPPQVFSQEYIDFNRYSRRQGLCMVAQLLFVLFLNGLQLGRVISHANRNNRFSTKAVAITILKQQQQRGVAGAFAPPISVANSRICEITTGFIAGSLIMSVACVVFVICTIRTDIRYRYIQPRMNRFGRIVSYLIAIITLTNVVIAVLTYFAIDSSSSS